MQKKNPNENAQVKEAVRARCLAAAQAAYEDAGVRGLCAEGRWECALDAIRAIGIVINGKQGGIEVNGVKYSQVMTPQASLNNEQIANVMTFVMNSWGNQGDAVTPATVAEVRSAITTEAAKEPGH